MRVLVDPPATGSENMRRDLALLAEGVPTVRLYGWRPACVSLGYAQAESDIDAAFAARMGFDVVRRPTGGGAILHDVDEVTYSVVLPKGVGPPDLFGSYRFIASGVVATLSELGIEATFSEGHSGRDPLCYLRDEGVAVTVGGRKISGGAQKRTPKGVLQHGTVLLSRRDEVLARLFGTTPERVRSSVACVQDFRPEATRADVLRAAVKGFVRALAPTVAPSASVTS